MIVELDSEKIKVGAVFVPFLKEGKKLVPLWFSWRNRRYKIKEQTHFWETWEGEEKIYHFSVLDYQNNLFEICYNLSTLVWTVEKIETEG